MSQHPKVIRIINPVCGNPFTSLNRARRFIATGRAEWAGASRSSIRFLSGDHRHRAAQSSATATNVGYALASNQGIARIGELVHVPVVAPAMLLGLGRRKGATRHVFLAAAGLVT